MTTGRARLGAVLDQLRGARLGAVLNQLPLWLGLVLLWMLLWGSVSWLTLLTGAGLAAIVSRVFYLPAVQLSGRLNPGRTLLFLLRLLADVIRASMQVAYLALAPHYRAGNAILAVPLRTRSDLVLTWTAVATSIVPGSIVVDTDRVSSTLYLHVVGVHTAADTERVRAGVLATERRIVGAFGSREDLERLGTHPRHDPPADVRADPRTEARHDPREPPRVAGSGGDS